MTDALILQAAVAEVKTRSWGVTDQFLAVHELEYEAGEPAIARLDQMNGTLQSFIFRSRESGSRLRFM